MSSNFELININNIYSNNGNQKKDWENFIKDINNNSSNEQIIFLLQKSMKENPQNEITVDIIDLIVDYGSPQILNLIAQKQFLDSFLNLLKSETKAGVENQKKVIYLTQKWATKFGNNPSFSIFRDNFNFLKGNGIAFPPDNFVMKTYDKFISQEEIKNSLLNNQNNTNNNFNPYNINSSNNQSNNNSNNFYTNYDQNIQNNNQKVINPFENNNSNQNDGFPMGNNNNDDFPRNNNYNNNYNFNNSNSGQINNPYNAYNSFDNNNNNFCYQQSNSYSYGNNNNYSNNTTDPNTLVETWRQKVKTYNGYIEEGKFSYHAIKLKEGIKEILNSFQTIENAMNQCFSDNIRRNLANVKSDMEQTCYRYQCLRNDKKVEPFQSAFDGNSRKYFFDANNMFKEKEYIPYSQVEQENQILSGLEKFGGAIKDGAMFVGQKIKDAAVGGYDYVKEKWDERGNNQ